MSKRTFFAIALAIVASIVLIPTAANAVYKSVTSADGRSWAGVTTYGSVSAPQVQVHDSSADGNGPTVYIKIGGGAWLSKGNPNGSGTTVTWYPSQAAGPGTTVSFYVCNANTQTGYRSCSNVSTFTA